jgi:sugar lactone lactonase YvrE
MPSKKSSPPEVETLLTGLAMGESPRWHENRLWFSDWGAQEIVAVDLDGNSEVVVRTPFGLPFCIDWLPDGRLLIVSGRESLLLRRELDGALVTHSDLRGLSDKGWNEIVVDGRGNAYINGGPGIIALVTPDRSARRVADGIAFPNGMTVTPDNAVWYADVPNKRCVRVREGGEVLQTIDLDRGCFACMLGGTGNRTLFLIAAEWRGMENIPEVARARTGQVLTVEAPAPGVGWP